MTKYICKACGWACCLPFKVAALVECKRCRAYCLAPSSPSYPEQR